MEEVNWIFVSLLPIVAFMYAAVGHGGASGYLAMMAMFAFPAEVMKPTGLMLNLFVAGIAFLNYWRMGHFNFKLFLAFAIGSIPLSFVGGMIKVDTEVYKLILGVLLIFAVLKMLDVFGRHEGAIKSVRLADGILVGGVIGFFSGLIGIGGGIILSPVILIMHWGNMKETAAVSALFIWVNSAAGMMGQLTAGVKLDPYIWLFVAIAVIGGFFGAYYGSVKMNNKALRYLLAFVLTLASTKLILT